MGSRDLQPVRFQIVDQCLAEAAFLAHLLLAAERAREGASAVGAAHERLITVLCHLAVAVAGFAGHAVRSTRPS